MKTPTSRLFIELMITGVTLWLTLNASRPAWMTGAKTVSLSVVSANMSGIWSRRLQRKVTVSKNTLASFNTSTEKNTQSYLAITALDSW